MSVFVSSPSGVEDESRWQGYISRIRARDSQGLALLYDETSRVVFGLALRMLADPVPAEETMLTVYQHVWDSPEACAGQKVLEALILQTRGRSLERIRRGGKSVPIHTEAPQAASGSEQTAPALHGLTPEERQSVELAFFRGLSVLEIATMVDAPVDTIKQRICAGTAKLRDARRSSPQESAQ